MQRSYPPLHLNYLVDTGLLVVKLAAITNLIGAEKLTEEVEEVKKARTQDDIEEEFTDTQYGKAIGISEDTAAKIKTFIDEMYNNGVKNWYIHCRSGKSRSVAVGIYLIEYLLSHNESYKDNDFNKEHANKRVLKLIRDCDA